MRRRSLGILLCMLLVAVVVALYLYGTSISLLGNIDEQALDQGATLSYAKDLATSHYRYIGDRNRMPLYPLLVSVFFRQGMSDAEYFWVGKVFNIALSLPLLVGLWATVAWHLPRWQAANLALVYISTVSIFKASYAQCELLFYFLNFSSFLLLSWFLVRPDWRTGLAAGLLLALAHLTKASMLPGAALFFGCVGVRLLVIATRAIIARRRGALVEHGFGPLLVGSLGCAIVFLAVLSPYLINSKRIYGQYFYNVNSTFYMWYDSWKEAKKGTRAAGDRIGWPTMAADEIPSPQRYLRTHTLAQIASREWQGLRSVVHNNLSSGLGYAKYFLGFLAVAAGLCFVRWRDTLAMACRYTSLLLFWASFFVVYLALYAWYVPIASGIRLILGQFLPAMYVLSLIIARHGTALPPLTLAGRRLGAPAVLNGLLSLALVVDAYFVLAYRLAGIGTYAGQ